MAEKLKSLYRGKFLEMVSIGAWEFVVRVRGTMPVGIAAMTADRRMISITQYRVPVDRVCVEIPAGLAGDGEDAGESWKVAAMRELREETGYTAQDMELLTQGATSAGLTSECIKLVRAIGVEKAGAQEPDGDEQIEVHEVPLAEVEGFLKAREARGELVDPKVYAALYFLRRV